MFSKGFKGTITSSKFKDFVDISNKLLFVVVLYSAFIGRNMYTTYAMSLLFFIITVNSNYEFVIFCRETFLEVNTALLCVGAIKATKLIGAGVLKVGLPAMRLCFLCASCFVISSMSVEYLSGGI